MILFFQTPTPSILAVQARNPLNNEDINKLIWLFNDAKLLNEETIKSFLVGPRREMITPWSTNAVEITQIMDIQGIARIEEFQMVADKNAAFDPMLQKVYDGIGQDVFTIHKQPEKIISIDDIAAYNRQEGLALSAEEIDYLNSVSERLGRKLTDSEVFGFSQVNSEHCRHKIFNGLFVIDGVEKESSLFQLIKKTSQINPNQLVSAYKDNVSFNQGPVVEQFAPSSGDKPDFFEIKPIETVISLKAETHNFPTTVEPFNGAATGSGGEIRDRLGGGKASLPIAGTAVYMTSSPTPPPPWERAGGRPWLYQTPEQILIKASNGASDFGNKFGQPLICGSVLTFEHEENNKQYGYDKVIMLAGGVGFAKKEDALKGTVEAGEKVVILGGDNYRIGMGGGAVSSVDTGEFATGIELNAVQRANPEMQKRVANVIRSLAESDTNPIVSIHDHGAGGHLNCLSELVETTGGKIEMNQLPVGDPTLSAKEIIGNESQERMGLVMKQKDLDHVQQIAERERAPMYVVGETTGDMQFVFEQTDGQRPIDMQLSDFFGKPPRTVMNDHSIRETFHAPQYDANNVLQYLNNVLQLEAVACKDWLTNKVDRSVTGKVARQQCQGEIQLPLSDLGAVALDYRGKAGIATSIGHAPQVAMVDAAAGSVMAIAESLTNIVFAPLKEKLSSVSLSANWMWPCRNAGEDARLYEAVEACSQFACDLGINIPTGKDSLSMTQKYGDKKVFAPGTVIISAGAEVSDIRKIVSPVVVNNSDTALYYIDFSKDALKLGGSALAQSLYAVGDAVPTVTDAAYFKTAFNTVQQLIEDRLILAGHDISAGGLITTLLEMCFANVNGGLQIDLKGINETDIVKLLFSENPAIIIQVADKQAVEKQLSANNLRFAAIGHPVSERKIAIAGWEEALDIDTLRDSWYHPSYQLDRKQSGETCAKARFENYKQQALQLQFPSSFQGILRNFPTTLNMTRKDRTVKAAIIREKGTNGEREMAYALYLAGFDVKDAHMTDLASGRETLENVNMIVFCGGFSNSDVLGSAKGWAGAFRYNEKSREALTKFYARPDTLSLGICNGCQLMVELNLIYPDHKERPVMLHNDSHKFESEFVSVSIPDNHSVMFGSLSGAKLGIWVAHGEGKFHLPAKADDYHFVANYVYDAYPANPNGSDYSTAGICSHDGRHVAMMPHLERAIFPWQWAHYPQDRKEDELSPWLEAFVNAREWVQKFSAFTCKIK
ncbi:MAG: Phosphoribosylformylglycinamidine synthase [Candidatus Ordinivivax streblomastigis]|uniref:Phosphoribosylformylglycinamidine synthase n=1 Tax=Candidatus Ordinivivax streblomastigis TaxID=2540710 RepID=A0A5M8P2F7_9BACT|nr:MAG: Phosphoribosylformylglycinamidine synthase [Candidatus Ordinivivax streblomastigis]